MYKKYKIKKRKKIMSPYYIFAIFAISLLFVSFSYALFSDTLTIRGKVTFLSDDTSDIEYGNSTYSWAISSEWGGTSGYYYNVTIPIVNLDADYDYWEISFDVPEGFDLENTNGWQAASMTYSGNTVTLTSPASGGYIILPNGSTLTLGLIMAFEHEVDFDITNLILNGKYARCTNESSPDDGDNKNETNTNTSTNTTNTTTNTTDNNVVNNETNTNVVTNNTTENTNTVENNVVENNTTDTNTTVPEEPDKPETTIELAYNWSLVSHWGTSYQITISITNNGDKIDPWQVSFDIPEGFIADTANFYNASLVSYSGNTITLSPSSQWSTSIESGKTLTLNMQLNFESEVDFGINNFVLNGTTIPYSP